MGIYAIVRDNYVDNVIVLNEDQIDEMAAALNAEIVDALPYGLCKGDLRVGGNWTRNINGVQTILEPITPQQQTDYAGLRNEVLEQRELLEAAEAALVEGVESIG